MDNVKIDMLIKHISLYLSIFICYFKIIDYPKFNISKKLIVAILIITTTIIQLCLQTTIPKFYRMFLVYTLYIIVLGKLTNTKFTKSAIIASISIAISYAFSIISALIIAEILFILYKSNVELSNPYVILIISILAIILTYSLFRIKKFKHGFPFIKNKNISEMFDIIIILIAMIIIIAYFMIGFLNSYPPKYIIYALLLFSFLSIVIIQKVFVVYHKQKLQTQALKDYENELSETKQKLETAIEEKQKLVKSNHEFYHRQQALNKKLDDLIKLQTISDNTEFAEEFSNIQDRIQKLSNEYSNKTRTIPKLVKTNIEELDDMLSYMQSECEQNNIEFVLKIDCDINHIIENFITKSQLETLLGDLIRNAIIAINHSSTEYRSILVVFGIKDDSYELCIFDSGIPFEINTLLNLGLQPASTHTNEGGTGIGFITTFETINSCNASFIINENTNSNYSKSMEIKFDNKHEYIIISDRKEKINELNQSNRKIILK